MKLNSHIITDEASSFDHIDALCEATSVSHRQDLTKIIRLRQG